MKISVVIPAYNAQSFLQKTLISVRDQTEQTEIVVVDDCSQDDTARIARDFIAQNALNGMVLRNAKNHGPSIARNVGWQAASSDWIQFLDADDVLGSSKLERQIAAAQSVPNDVAVLYSPWQRLRADNGDWKPSGQVKRSRIDLDTITAILKDPYFGIVGPTLVRRSALQAIGGFQPEMNLGEDLDLMLRIGMAGWRFRLVESAEPLFFYRDTPESLWGKASSDCDAVMRCLRAVRSSELYLREHNGQRMQASTRRAIALRYRSKLEILHSCDANNFMLVNSWISELGLRSPRRSASHFSSSAKSPIYKMDSVKLRGKFVLRGTLARLRSRHHRVTWAR